MRQLERKLADYACAVVQSPRSGVLTGWGRQTSIVDGIVDALAGKGMSAFRGVNFLAAAVRLNGYLAKSLRWPQT